MIWPVLIRDTAYIQVYSKAWWLGENRSLVVSCWKDIVCVWGAVCKP